MVHISKKFGQKDFICKILIINQVDTPKLIPCSAKNCLNTFSSKLAKCVGEERGFGKAVCEERECIPQRRMGPVVPERSVQQAENSASVGNPESDGREVEVACMWCAFGE